MNQKIKASENIQTQTTTTIDKNRQALSLQSMRFNRFLGIRYLTAVFFFANLWWAIIASNLWSKWLPVGLMVLAIPVIYEQIKLFGTPNESLAIYHTLFPVPNRGEHWPQYFDRDATIQCVIPLRSRHE